MTTGSGNPGIKGHVLITGGSGLVGKYLTSLLLENGYRVSHLSRNREQFGRVRVFRWNPGKEILDPLFLEDVDYIVHLAGSNIGDKRWKDRVKEEILRSRTGSADLLYRTVLQNNIKLKAFISASATGYYGTISSGTIFMENDSPGNDFLAGICRAWEASADRFGSIGIRTVKIRTGIVLERNEGALTGFLIPAKYGLFPVLGTGSQYIPWIHIKDLCNIYLRCISDQSVSGVYNAVAPEGVTQREFIKTLSLVSGRPFFHIPVPGFILRIMFGEMSSLLLEGSRVSCEKIENAGYRFEFYNLHEALKDIISPRSAFLQP